MGWWCWWCAGGLGFLGVGGVVSVLGEVGLWTVSACENGCTVCCDEECGL